jgi:hypothetical protein
MISGDSFLGDNLNFLIQIHKVHEVLVFQSHSLSKSAGYLSSPSLLLCNALDRAALKIVTITVGIQ